MSFPIPIHMSIGLTKRRLEVRSGKSDIRRKTRIGVAGDVNRFDRLHRDRHVVVKVRREGYQDLRSMRWTERHEERKESHITPRCNRYIFPLHPLHLLMAMPIRAVRHSLQFIRFAGGRVYSARDAVHVVDLIRKGLSERRLAEVLAVLRIRWVLLNLPQRLDERRMGRSLGNTLRQINQGLRSRQVEVVIVLDGPSSSFGNPTISRVEAEIGSKQRSLTLEGW